MIDKLATTSWSIIIIDTLIKSMYAQAIRSYIDHILGAEYWLLLLSVVRKYAADYGGCFTQTSVSKLMS